MIVTTISKGAEGYGIPGESWSKWWILELSEPVSIHETIGSIPEEIKDHILTHCRAWGHPTSAEAGSSFSEEASIYIDNLSYPHSHPKNCKQALVIQHGGLDI